MIIFLYGPDTYRGKQKLIELKDKFKREVDPQGYNLVVLDGKSVNLNEIGQKIGPSSLLVKKRMIVVEDLFQNKIKNILTEVYDYFDKNKIRQEENIIVFWETSLKSKTFGQKEEVKMLDSSGREKALTKEQAKFFGFLRKQKFVQEFKELSNTEINHWIKTEAEKRGANISLRAANLLAGLVGGDLWKMSQEIDKLINYKIGLEPKLTEGGKPVEIDINEVEGLVRGSFDENIFALTDALSAKNKKEALRLLEEQYASGLTDTYLLSMIARQFKILLQIRQALDQGQTSRKIISDLGLHPFVVQKGINQARYFSLEIIKAILDRLMVVDYKMKTGQADARIMLDLLFAKI